MKPTRKSISKPRSRGLAESDIRDYAYHLYEQSGRAGGRDLDNWLEAEACLRACIPMKHSHVRLHFHTRALKRAS